MKITRNKINKIKDILISMLMVNIYNLEYQKSMTNVKKYKNSFTTMILHTNKAISLIRNCKHFDILADLYNAFVAGRETFFIALSESVYKNVEKWDTEEGHKEFIELQKDAIEKSNAEEEEKKKIVETIQKAKEEGKKIQFVYDKGKITPVAVTDDED